MMAALRIGLCVLFITLPRSASADVIFVALLPNGSRVGPLPVNSGPATLPLGATIQLDVADNCRCTATLKEFEAAGSILPKDITLPVSVFTGTGGSKDSLSVGAAGAVRLRMRVTRVGAIAVARQNVAAARARVAALEKEADQSAENKKELEAAKTGLTDLTEDLGRLEAGSYEELMLRIEPKTWWTVADTIAYAVTRQSGNTAIAGAGVFVDPASVLYAPVRAVARVFGRRLASTPIQEVVQASLIVHLLPPAEGDGPADIGVSPIGLGFFDTRVVLGIGWNVSRHGKRPESHNRYVYFGFSASKLLAPRVRESSSVTQPR